MEQSDFKQLVREIIRNSEADNWDDARLEWECIYHKNNTVGKCICGHPLNNLYYIRNKTNYIELIVGSTCVLKFDTIEMSGYVKKVHKLLREEKSYNKLKEAQIQNNIPPSIRKDFIKKRLTKGVINKIEYDFYMQIWLLKTLSEKQSKWKESINNKLLNSIQK